MAARRSSKASQGPASPRLALSEHTPTHLKVLADRLQRSPGGSDDATHGLRGCLDGLSAYFGAIALALVQQQGSLSTNEAWSLQTALTATGWRLMLADACVQLAAGPSRPGRELAAACADTGWQDIRVESWPSEPVEAALASWLKAATPFFSRWTLMRDGSRTVLRGAGADLDLFPFLRVEDCPDCDGVAQTFVYDGPASATRVRYRNLQNGHAISVACPPDAPDWMRPLAAPAAPPRPMRPVEGVDPRHLRVQRLILESRGGYVVVMGDDRTGKSSVARRLAFDPELARRGFRVLNVAASRFDGIGPGLWLQALDEQLRLPTISGLPPRELVGQLQRMDSAEHRTRAWLSALAAMDERPLVLVIDDVHLWAQSADAWPVSLPPTVHVVLLAARQHLPAALGTRLDQLVDAGAITIALGEAAQAPPAPTAVLPVLTRLAAARCALPLPVLIDQAGRDACLRAARWLRPSDGGVEPVHPAATHPDWSSHYKETCAQMAWWARDILLDASASREAHEIARDGLWRWAREGGLAARLCRDAALHQRMRDLLTALAPLAALSIASEWVEAARPLLAAAASDVDDLLDLSLWRAELLLHLSCYAEAAQAAGAEIGRLQELMRGGRPELGLRLAQALSLRAWTALHRQMPTTAAEDAARALELYALHEVRTAQPLPGHLTAPAHHALGLAFAASGNTEPAALSLARAAELMEKDAEVLGDLAALYLRARRLPDAERVASLAIDAATRPQQRAENLCRRAMVLGALHRHEEAGRDLREAVDVYARLVAEGRVDLAAAAAQARFELGCGLSSANRLPESREQFEEAARLFHEAIDEQGRRGCRPLLAQVLNEHGYVCAGLGLTDEAIHLCTRAVDLGTQLLEREKRSSIRSELARALNNRARAFAAAGRTGSVQAALRDFQQAAAHYDVLVHRQHRYEYRHHLALVHYNRGGLHRTQNETGQAAREYRRAVDLLREVRAEHATREVTLDLAAALTNEALVLEPQDALTCYRQAVELLVGVYETDDPRTAIALASALHGEGRARAQVGRWEAAVGDFTAALGLYRKLQRTAEAAAALRDRGRAATSLRRFDRAAADFDEAARMAHGKLRASALCGLASALRACHALPEARRAYDEALDLYGEASTETPLAEVADAFAGRARLRLQTDDVHGAIGDIDSAERTLQALDGVRATRALLALANLRARALVAAQRWEEAMEVCRGVVEALTRLPAEDAEAARLLADACAQRGRAQRGRHRVSEAVDDFTRSIAAWSRQADEARDVDMCLELARVYRERADAQRRLGQTRNAVFDYGWTIDLLEELWREHDVRGLGPELASARAARGLLLMRDGRLREAVVDLRSAHEAGVEQEPESGLDIEAALRRAQTLLEARKPC